MSRRIRMTPRRRRSERRLWNRLTREGRKGLQADTAAMKRAAGTPKESAVRMEKHGAD
jgi:hypothetical protein